MKQPKVFVVGSDYNISRMFNSYGWGWTREPQDADLIQFTGGADVSPSLYGEKKHHTTYNDTERDYAEAGFFAIAQRLAIPMAGICRGGQFLNVMNGGSMWQDVDGHAIRGTHTLLDVTTGKVIDVTSTHHQMMVKAGHGCLIAYANEAQRKESMKEGQTDYGKDTEIVFYPDSKSLCFQPHPEYVQPGHECADYYFELLNRFFGLKAE